jgi:hypothetical protein
MSHTCCINRRMVEQIGVKYYVIDSLIQYGLKKGKSNNDLQNIRQKTKDRATRTPQSIARYDRSVTFITRTPCSQITLYKTVNYIVFYSYLFYHPSVNTTRMWHATSLSSIFYNQCSPGRCLISSSSNHSFSFCPISVDHCVVCPSSIYGFWLPLWYLQICLTLENADLQNFYVLHHIGLVISCLLWNTLV